jgi:hypothetical protein
VPATDIKCDTFDINPALLEGGFQHQGVEKNPVGGRQGTFEIPGQIIQGIFSQRMGCVARHKNGV